MILMHFHTSGLGVNHPAIVREIPQSCGKSCISPFLQHVCENITHFSVYFRKNLIVWKSRQFSVPWTYFVDRSYAGTPETRSSNVFDSWRPKSKWKSDCESYTWRHLAQKCICLCLRMHANRRPRRRKSSVPHSPPPPPSMLTPMRW